MITAKQLNILEPYLKNIFQEHSYKELKGREKSNNYIQLAIKRFKEQNLLLERKIGTSKLYTLNQKNELIYPILELIIQDRLSDLIKKSVSSLKNEVKKYTLFYSLVIFGSYAKGNFKKDSDLDIAIIIPDKNKEKYLRIAINSAENKSLLNLDVHIITIDEFQEMLIADYANLGKEIARHNLPIHNINIFYEIIKRGVDHGFKIVS